RRHARHGGDETVPDRHPDAGGGAAVVRDRLGAGGDERLHAVALGHHPAAAGEHVGDLPETVVAEDQFHAGDLGQHLTGQVVLGGAEAAGGEHQVGPLRGDAEGGDVVVEVVGNGGVEADRDADLREPAAEPLRARVEVLPAG